MVVVSFLRLVTHPKGFVLPAPKSAALRIFDALLAAPRMQQPLLAAQWPDFRKLCTDKALMANHVPHAWRAAAVIA